MDAGLWNKAVAFHGHECPGLAIGFKACEAARSRLGLGASPDEEIVCVTENDACGVDAVQALLSCTFGKGNLIYRGTGKQAFSFFERSSGRKPRIAKCAANWASRTTWPRCRTSPRKCWLPWARRASRRSTTWLTSPPTN